MLGKMLDGKRHQCTYQANQTGDLTQLKIIVQYNFLSFHRM